MAMVLYNKELSLLSVSFCGAAKNKRSRRCWLSNKIVRFPSRWCLLKFRAQKLKGCQGYYFPWRIGKWEKRRKGIINFNCEFFNGKSVMLSSLF